MFYTYEVIYYNEVMEKDEIDRGIVYGASYKEAMEGVMHDYATIARNTTDESFIISVTLSVIPVYECKTLSVKDMSLISPYYLNESSSK